MRVRLLGPVHALHGTRAVGGTPQQRAVLALLALRCGRVVPTDVLIDELWPSNPPRGGRATVHTYVSRLRSALGTPRLRSESAGYVLDVPPAAVDAHVFEEASDQARAIDDPEQRQVGLAAALAMWEGPALAGVPAGPLLEAATARLEELRIEVLEARIDVDLERGRHGAVLAELDGLALEHPYRERLHLQRMLALYRAGRAADALRAYQDIRDLLRSELGVDPAVELQDLHSRILRGDPTLGGVASDGPFSPVLVSTGNIPARLTSFVGRERERAQLEALLSQTRLVTVTGTGGSGKTRLAVEVAAGLQESFRDGAWLAELGALSDGRFVGQTVARLLGVAERPGVPVVDELVVHLARRETLVVLDNCEHVAAEAAALVQALLGRCATLRVLATSREPLRIDGETTLQLEPFAVPGEVDANADVVRLFTDRARTARPDLALAEHTDAVVHICRTLDGIPLAIELAAARLRSMDIGHLAAVIDDRLRVLVGGPRTAPTHHRTLRAAIDWSYDLLEPEEAVVFRRLAVFAGGVTPELAEQVAGAGLEGDVLAVLSSLVDKGLLGLDRSGTLPYRMLETVRQYALEHLEQAAEEPAVRRRHAEALLALAVECDVGLREGDQERCLVALEAQHDNVRAAIAWCLGHAEAELGLRLAGRMWWFWQLTMRLDEGRSWLASALEAAPDTVAPGRRVRALVGAGCLTWLAGHSDHARVLADQALALAQQAGSRHGEAVALGLHTLLAIERGAFEQADRSMDAATAAFEEIGQPWGPMALLAYSGIAALQHDELERAEAVFTASAQRFTAAGDLWGVNWARWGLARLATRRGDPAAAVALLRENLPFFRGAEGTLGLTYDVEGLGLAAFQAGAHRLAARLLAAAAAANGDRGVQLLPSDRADDARAWRVLRSRLSAGVLEREVRTGSEARDRLLDFAFEQADILAEVAG